jgi:hypothetical protein
MRTSIYGVHPGVAMVQRTIAEVMKWLKQADEADA